MLAPLRRARIRLPAATSPRVAGVEFHRVICTAGKDRIALELK
jgi:hypothetical protein